MHCVLTLTTVFKEGNKLNYLSIKAWLFKVS